MISRRWAVGLISGTSMDGIDAALVELDGPAQRVRVRMRAFLTAPYPGRIHRDLLRLASGGETTADGLSRLSFALGSLFADAAVAVCRRGRIPPQELSVIGSHGQTVFHEGPRQGPRGSPSAFRPASTLQIAEPAVIAEVTRAPVVADFRTADMAAGGHGAPLVPMMDYLMFRDPKRDVATLNIGGIANVTIVPAKAQPEDVTGFDTGPGNMVIDGLVRRFTQGRRAFDEGGRWASRGAVLEPLLARILRLPFFHRRPPKSAGREEFGAQFIDRYFIRHRARHEDLLRTATELTARTIAEALRRFTAHELMLRRLIISGGGAHNRLLLGRLADLLPEIEMVPSAKCGVPEDAKEAVAFALLADRTMHGLVGNLPSVTGARRGVILGKLIRP
jgi:anhydro-N-acetylmuramic acid kinase